MYARTAAFDAAIRSCQTVSVVADLLLDGVVVFSGLPVVGGGIEVDGTAAVRRRCNLTVVDATGEITPNDPTDPLSPYGREIQIRRGVRFPDGTTEHIALGVFRMSTVAVNDSGSDRKITVTGFDRSRSVSRARFEAPYSVAAGTNYGTAIYDLIVSRLPDVVASFVSTSRTTPLLVFDQGADPWATAQEMATSIGAELFFNPDGICVLKFPVDPTTQAIDWEYAEGDDATVLSIDNTLSDEPGYNGVVVDGEPPDAPPVHAVVYDSNPLSPTYYLGAYGKVPRFYRSQFITTLAQAEDVANAMLLAERGGTEQLKFTCIPHPAHEVDDLVHVVDPLIGVDDNYVLESFTMPLDLGVMSATTRKRRSA